MTHILTTEYTEDLVPEDFRIHGIAKIGHLRIARKSVGMHLASCSDYIMKFEQGDGDDIYFITGQVCPGEHFLRHADRCQPTSCNILVKDGESFQDMYSDDMSFCKLKSIYRAQGAIVGILKTDYINSIGEWIGHYNDLAGLIELPDADFAEARQELVKYATETLLQSKQSLRERGGDRLFFSRTGEFQITSGEEQDLLEEVKKVWLDKDDKLLNAGNTEKLWEEYNVVLI